MSQGYRAQAIVEFALSLPVLLLLILGVLDAGRGVVIAIMISNAAREGARFAADPPARRYVCKSQLSDRSTRCHYESRPRARFESDRDRRIGHGRGRRQARSHLSLCRRRAARRVCARHHDLPPPVAACSRIEYRTGDHETLPSTLAAIASVELFLVNCRLHAEIPMRAFTRLSDVLNNIPGLFINGTLVGVGNPKRWWRIG